jgi:hypothetical protein
MQIILPADAPLILRTAAAAGLGLHIGGAVVGLGAGTVATFASKGGRLHRLAGTTFFLAMLAMGSAAAATSPFNVAQRWGNAIGGLFVIYLAVTGWAAARSAPFKTGPAERAGLVMALGIVGVGMVELTVGVATAWQAAISGGLTTALLASLAAWNDWRIIRMGGLAPPQRTGRHLWRMMFLLFACWGSFAGQPKAIGPLFGNPLTFLPALACLAYLALWMLRIRRPRVRKAAPAVAFKGVTS